VSPQAYNAYRFTAQFVSPDGRIVQFLTTPKNNDIGKASAIDAVPDLRAALTRVQNRVGAAESGLFGYLAFSYDINSVSGSDLHRLIPIVAVLIAFLLAAVLRSLVAPLYLVASVVFSYLAALGLAGIIFVRLGGQSGLNFVLPFIMFIFLMALGSDYNILVMSRIREEAERAPMRQAVLRAVGATGTTITTAGLILGGTFAVLGFTAPAGSNGDQIRQIGYGIAAGILMDTFLVRTLLVPSIATLLGRWTWWPSQLWHRPVLQPAPTRRAGAASGTADDDAELEISGRAEGAH
jgi:RND superfamily putative drug exporter